MAEQFNKDRHIEILKAAQQRFARFGLSKVTMDEIANDVGLGKASLYYYFPTKESLFRAVIESEQKEFSKRADCLLAKDMPAGEKLLEYASHRLAFFRELVNLNTLSFQPFLSVRPLFQDLVDELAQRDYEAVRRILNEGRKNGEFDLSSTERHARLFQRLLQGLRLRMMRDLQNPDRERAYGSKELEEDMKLLCGVFIRGIAARNNHTPHER